MVPSDSRVVVFVYGTLRRGEANHGLLQNAEYLGEASTYPEFDLYDFGGYPGIVLGGHTSIAGELYAVDSPTLSQLDELERHPVWYARQLIQMKDGRCAEAYILPHARSRRARRLDNGDWCLRTRAKP